MSRSRTLAETALAIARERAELLAKLRVALAQGDDAEALRLARRLTGLEEGDGESDRTAPRVH